MNVPQTLQSADPNQHMVIEVYSHHVVVKTNVPAFRIAIREFTRKWMRFSFVKDNRTGKYSQEFMGTYACATKDRSQVRYHINQLPAFMDHIGVHGVPKSKTILIQNPYQRVDDKVEVELLPGWVPRDEQPEVIEYALKNDYPIKMLTIQTGQGKSATSLFINQIKQERFCLVTRPSYLKKWIIDIEKMYKVKKSEIVLIQGGDSLKALIEIAKAGEIGQYKAILISNRTLLSFIEDYEENNGNVEDIWGCTPDDLYRLLGIDTLYVDEGHQDMRILFKIYMYLHVEKLICMSATFDPDEAFLKKVTEVLYPKQQRYVPKLSNKHTVAYSVRYHFNNPRVIRCMSRGQYSHLNFEKSILRNKTLEENYYRMILTLLENHYLGSMKPGYKAIVFCYTIKMCTRLKEFLQKRIQNLKVGRYVQEDKYEDMLAADIVITTIKSAGTAVDIPGLYVGIMTVALRSSQTNIQVLGRLRRMQDGNTPKFFWLTNSDNLKHRAYDTEKWQLFKNRTKSVGEIVYSEYV